MGEKELLDKKNSRIKRLPNNASLGRTAFIEDIHSSADRSIDKTTLKKLSARSIIDQKLTRMISGKIGSGDTSIACALDNCVCRYGYTVIESPDTCPDASGFAVRIRRNTQTGAKSRALYTGGLPLN